VSLTAQFFSNALLFMILARFTDVSTLGEIMYAAVFANIVVVLVSYGLDNLVVREISQSRYALSDLAVNLVFAKAVLSVLMILLLLAFMRLLSVPLKDPSDLWVYVAAALLNSFVNSLCALRKGKNDFVTEIRVSLFRNATFFVGVLIAVYLWGTSTLLVGQVRLLTAALALGLAIILFLKELGEARSDLSLQRLHATVVKMLFVVGFPFALQAVLGTAYVQVDTLVLGAIRGSTEVGYYQAAMQIVSAMMLIPTAVIQAFYPRLAHEYSTKGPTGTPTLKRMLVVLVVLGPFLAAVLGLGASLLVATLFGTKMQPSVVVLQILSLIFLVRPLAGGLGISLMSVGLQKVLALAGSVALVTSLTLNLLLVPTRGYVAAAWVALITNVIILGIYLFEWRRASARLANSPSHMVV
jgi:O-antigen/teichoic acid export membrane protein